MWTNFINETEMPGTKITPDQLQIISHRYYFTSKFVSGKRVLEVCCGPGLGLGYLSRNAEQVVGGDITLDSLRVAQEHYCGKVGLTLMDAHKLPFRDGYFDVVVCLAAIIYLDLPVFFDECHRVLKKNGTLILNSPNRDQPGFQGSLLSNRYYSVPDLFKLLKTHNFDAELFGAFPVKNQMVKSIERNFLPTIIRISGKILDCIPKGEGLKEWLKEIFFPLPPPIILKNEIEEDIVANVQPFPISSDSPDVHHRIIYVIAHSYDPELNHSISGNFKSPE